MTLDNPPFADNMTDEEVEDLLNRVIRQSERYRVLNNNGKNFDEIKENFNQPVDMTVFSWRGEIDTIMSPHGFDKMVPALFPVFVYGHGNRNRKSKSLCWWTQLQIFYVRYG